MKTVIVLLRGINVGGHRKMQMADLRELLSSMGYQDVKSYIQSGNVILKSDKNSKEIKVEIETKILNHFGFEVLVLVKSLEELQYIFNSCPFAIEEKEKCYFMMLDGIPDNAGIKQISDLYYKDEKFLISENCIYFFSTKGYGRTKFNSNFFEKKLKVNATARNHKTMLKLLAMAGEAEYKP